MVVARVGHCVANHRVVLVARVGQRREGESKELRLGLGLAWVEPVDASVGAHRPVVVLAAAVDAGERLLMEQEDQVVLGGNVHAHLHRNLVQVAGNVGDREEGRNFVLGGGHFVVVHVERAANLEQRRLHVVHARFHALRHGREVVEVHLLALGRGRANERAPASSQVWPRQVRLLGHHEKLLLPPEVRHALLHVVVAAEVLEQAQAFAVHRVLREV